VAKKPEQSSKSLRWSRDWYQSASADELMSALREAETAPQADNDMQKFVDHLIWEIRFQMLEDELKRRLLTPRSA
jgi:hypothetical protein